MVFLFHTYFFVDDNILFSKANREGIEAIKEVVNEYKQIWNQIVNFEKSLIYFSNNVEESEKTLLGETLGVRIANNLEKYLELPTMIDRRKKGAFLEIKEKFAAKIQSWSIKNLSIDSKRGFY